MSTPSGWQDAGPHQAFSVVMVGVLLVIVLMASAGCDPVGRSEVRRVTSPDSRVDAVLLEGSGGATTGFFCEIHVVFRGAAPPAKEEPQFLITGVGGCDDLAIDWNRSKLMAITYKHGWIRHFTNRWSWHDGKGSSYVVELRLVPPPGNEFALPETLRL